MRPTMRHVLISAIFAAATLPALALAQDAPAAPATPAQVTNGQVFGDWTVRCEALGVNRTRCMLSQTISVRDSGAVLADLLAFWTDDEDQRILVAQVPVGAHLPSGFVLQPEGTEDEADRLDFVWQTCNPRLCEAVALPDQESLDKLLGAERVLAGYRPAVGAEPAVFPISTNGLVEGLEALKPAAAE
ncbi:invasion associated locus B family protein [Paracoccus sp. M683]|uniref:invasion associated locus B family protein n=1 Tax=Paracoccus sp. M683 TaxID=2594268 RepID=UPI001C8F9928|nr:invasion associated locus B family protein [Paracoccus sp. M683]